MNRGEVENGIQKSWRVVDSLGLAESFSSGAVLEAADEFKMLATSDDAEYSDVFLAGLRLSCYNFVLVDYSYFQFGWSGQDEVRYAYYPNPFLGSQKNTERFRRLKKALEHGHITFEDYHASLMDHPPECRIPLFRYENAPSQRKEFRHPCSHLHIGHHSENRWALQRLMTPLAFCLVILKQYYAEEWAMFGDDDASAYKSKLEKQLVDERQNCRILGADMFSLDEQRSFFLS